MLIERQIEEKLIDAISNAIVDCEIVGSWTPVQSGTVKGESDREAKGNISIYVQPRSHDSFSLPSITLNGTIAVECRAEKCPTMAEVSEIYEQVLGLLTGWHNDPNGFSDYFSSDDFFATEIMLNGGSRVSYDRTNATWLVDTNFIIRGVAK